MDAPQALLAAAALHAGFQATVTAVVYPALVATPPGAWAAVHAAHSRRITPVVAVVHGALLLAWVLVLRSAAPSPALGVALAGTLLTVLTTALVAAPVHGRLGREGPRPGSLRRLVRADAVRSVGAALTLGGALVAVW